MLFFKVGPVLPTFTIDEISRLSELLSKRNSETLKLKNRKFAANPYHESNFKFEIEK